MHLYRKIDVKNLSSLQRKLLDLVPEELFTRPRIYFLPDQSEFLKITELIELIDTLSLDITKTNFGFYVMNPYRHDPVHLDWGNTEYSMNIPIANCDNTFTSFHLVHGEPELIPERTINGHYHAPHYSFNNVVTEMIEEFESNVPVVMHIKTPHSVINKTANFRINLLVRNTDNEAMKKILAGA